MIGINAARRIDRPPAGPNFAGVRRGVSLQRFPLWTCQPCASEVIGRDLAQAHPPYPLHRCGIKMPALWTTQPYCKIRASGGCAVTADGEPYEIQAQGGGSPSAFDTLAIGRAVPRAMEGDECRSLYHNVDASRAALIAFPHSLRHFGRSAQGSRRLEISTICIEALAP